MGETIPRADVAAFLLAELEDGTWTGELPHVTGTD
jgi:hypothetical protein